MDREDTTRGDDSNALGERTPASRSKLIKIVLGVTGAVVLVLALLLPLLAVVRRVPLYLQTEHMVWSITLSMHTFSEHNGGYPPGLDSNGQPVDLTVEGRFLAMLENNNLRGDVLVSPFETKTIWSTGPLTTANYSFALLDISEDNTRRSEWRQPMNTEAILVSDRNAGVSTDPDDMMSVHALAPGKWTGGVGRGDGSYSFEQDYRLPTRYGDTKGYKKDHIFEQAGGDDAAMIYSGE
jgi:hypothetical protein